MIIKVNSRSFLTVAFYFTPTDKVKSEFENCINKIPKAEATVVQKLNRLATEFVLYIEFGGLFFVTFFCPHKRKLIRVMAKKESRRL